MLRNIIPGALFAATLTSIAACTASGNGRPPADSMPSAQPTPGAVTTALSLGTDRVAPGDSIPLTLHVVNGTTEPLILEFTSSQRYELWLAPATGEPIWTWSADKLFMQALGQDTIAPGDTIQFADVVPAPSEPGSYRVIGSIVTTTRDLSDTAAVTVAR